MSYLVLARKYRPKTFQDVVGQSHVMRPLTNALKSERVAHAYLFSGARGVGKTTVARLLAMALNCPETGGEGPCGRCDYCLEIIEGHAVDVFEVDGASNRGINEIRDLRETIKYLPNKGRFKVYIIDEVHMLTKEAFNALLKTLEEPPEHVIFIFATTESHKVLPTILSRCQRYDFKRIGLQDIINRLRFIAGEEEIDISDYGLRVLARESEGGMRDALSLFDQVIAFSGLSIKDEDIVNALGLIDRALVAGLAEALLAGDAGRSLETLDQVYEFGHDITDFAARTLDFFRALVIVKVSRNPEKILDLLDAELAELKKMASEASLETLNFHFNAWLDVQAKLRWAGQPRLVIEALMVKLAGVGPLKSLAELTASLENLLKSIKGAGGMGAPPAPSSPRSSPVGGGYSGPTGERRESRSTQLAPSEPAQAEAKEPARNAGNEPAETYTPAAGGGGSWDDFSRMLKAKSPFLHKFLLFGTPRTFGSAKVEVVFAKKDSVGLIDRSKLQGFLSEFFGRRPELLLTVDDEAPAPVEAQTVNTEKIEKDIMNHPLIKQAEQMFSGEVVKVIPEP